MKKTFEILEGHSNPTHYARLKNFGGGWEVLSANPDSHFNSNGCIPLREIPDHTGLLKEAWGTIECLLTIIETDTMWSSSQKSEAIYEAREFVDSLMAVAISPINFEKYK